MGFHSYRKHTLNWYYKMHYLRFSLKDSNLSKTPEELIWNLPLTLDNKKVGLSSISLELYEHYNPEETSFITLTSNLLDHSMENQHGVLATLKRNEDNFVTFRSTSKETGNFSYVNKALLFGCLELWATGQFKFNTVSIKFLEIPVKQIRYLDLVLLFG